MYTMRLAVGLIMKKYPLRTLGIMHMIRLAGLQPLHMLMLTFSLKHSCAQALQTLLLNFVFVLFNFDSTSCLSHKYIQFLKYELNNANYRR